jgi:Tol biopolymer transport system component
MIIIKYLTISSEQFEIDAEYWKEKNIEALVTGSIVQESDDIYRLSVN